MTKINPHPTHTRASDDLRLFKYQALGNSYLVMDAAHQDLLSELFEAERGGRYCPKAEIVRTLCDKAWGIGANGLLFGSHAHEPGHFVLRIINSDGTPAGFSGNGVRIFAKYLVDAGYVDSGSAFNVMIIESSESGTAIENNVPIRIFADRGEQIEVTIPRLPTFGAAAIEATTDALRAGRVPDLSCSVTELAKIGAKLTGRQDAWVDSTLVFIGNPHCVTFVSADSHIPQLEHLQEAHEALRDISFRPKPQTKKRAAFQQGSNLQWVYVRARSKIQLAVFERGEGFTLASGSSAVAAAAAAFARGLVDHSVDVEMPGGSLHVDISGSPAKIESIKLTGTAVYLFEAFIPRAAVLQGVITGTN